MPLTRSLQKLRPILCTVCSPKYVRPSLLGDTLRACVKMWTSLWRKRLKCVLMEVLHHLNRFSIRAPWSAIKGATLQSLNRYAASIFKLQKGYKTSITANQAENHSRQRPSKNNNRERRPTAMMSIINNHNTELSSSSEKTASKTLNRSKRRFHTPKMSMTAQESVASITPQTQEP